MRIETPRRVAVTGVASTASPVRSVRAALADAGLHPSAITHVNAHGTSTPVFAPEPER